MLNKRELSAIRNALPEHGYQKIADKCGKSAEAVGQILREPQRYNADVINKAFEVIAEHKAVIELQKQKVKEL